MEILLREIFYNKFWLSRAASRDRTGDLRIRSLTLYLLISKISVKIPGRLEIPNSEYNSRSTSVTKINCKWCPIHWNCIKIENFQISGKFLEEKLQNNWNLEVLSWKLRSVTKTEWKWYPVHPNWSKSANIWEFPDFQKISGKIPEKLEFWNSDSTIMLSDLNWVGNIPKMSKLVQTSQFLGFSRFPDFQFPDSRKFQMSSKVCNFFVNMLH